jgi:HJR/Mrr/RecB family endonuclease
MSELTLEQHRARIKELPLVAESRAREAGKFSAPFSLNPWLTQLEQSQLMESFQAIGFEEGPSVEQFKSTHLAQPQAMAE